MEAVTLDREGREALGDGLALVLLNVLLEAVETKEKKVSRCYACATSYF